VPDEVVGSTVGADAANVAGSADCPPDAAAADGTATRVVSPAVLAVDSATGSGDERSARKANPAAIRIAAAAA
jgi:hypothetical protein